MDTLRIDEHNYILSRPTPWDERVFGFKTNELVDVRYQDIESLRHLIALFDRSNRESNVRFSYTRVNTEDKLLRHVLSSFSFYYAETSLSVGINKMDKQDFGANFKNDLPLTVPDTSDYDQIKEIARSSFDYSRFHEDYNIDIEKARDRYFYWIDDLVAQGKQALIYKRDGIVKSFLFYERHDASVDLILAGSIRGSDILSYYFWPSFMTYLQQGGCKKATTVISASNIGILNLYARLNFKFEKTLIGFHKMYDVQGGSEGVRA